MRWSRKRLPTLLRRKSWRRKIQRWRHTKRGLQKKAVHEAAEMQAVIDAENTIRAQEVLRLLTASDADGGFNFNSLEEFFDALWRKGGDATISSLITRYINRHGSEHAKAMFRRSKEAKEECISEALEEIFQREGRAIQAILTRDLTTTVTGPIERFFHGTACGRD